MNEDTETLLRQFIPEARDLLEEAGHSLLALERDPGAAEPLNALFRAVHTLKGTSGLFSVEPLTRLVHAGEDVLFAVQAGSLALAAELTDALLESLDQVGLWIEALAETSALPDDAEDASRRGVVRLRAMLGSRGEAATSGPGDGCWVDGTLPAWADAMARGLEAGGAGLLAIRYLPDSHCFFRGEDPLGLMRQLPGLRALLLDPVEPWAVLAEIDPFQCNMCLRAIVEAPRAEVEQWLRYALDQVEIVALPQGERAAAVCGPIASQPGVSQSSLPPPATLRVEQAKIDVLMNLIGELVVAKNAIAYLARCAEQGQLSTGELAREIKARHALVNRIAEDMQGAVMSVRMLPVEQIFQRFPRLVRDVSRRLGKRVELVVEGGDTEADKNIIEAIADPLIHMVRNSLDHGIETPEVRRQAGKPEHGTLRLTAVQDNDEVFIRVIDDGRGIDPAAVRRRAMEQGLIDGEQARAMSDEDAIALVFAPGFSTAPEVSDLSGRGVGMDVVRAAVEKVGGRVSIASRIGVGTTVELVLPLSLAVTRIMTVCCGDGLFGVPMSLVVETVRVARAALHRFRDREAFVLRDSVVPVLRLAALLGLPDEADVGEEVAILVVQIRGERLGLVVGAFREGMEAIVKPMEGVLADVQGFSGTTLLGDGRVLLVLDLRELVA